MAKGEAGPAAFRSARRSENAAAAKFHAAVERRAYQLHVENGRRDGHALDDWLEAERELRNSRIGIRD